MRHKLVVCLRYTLQIISLVFFVYLLTRLSYPAGWHAAMLKWLSHLDPWGLFNHLRWQHSFPVWGWLPILTLIITLIFGRVFCGWFCPFGALLMLVDKLSRIIFKTRLFKKTAWNRSAAVNRLQPFRYYWLAFLAAAFLFGINWAYSLSPFALFSHDIVRFLKETVPWILLLIVIITILFSRLWCSVLCPTGILLSLFSHFRIFRYQVSGHCTHCLKCTKNCPVGAAPADTGYAKESCIVCGECQNTCPMKAVSFQPFSASRKNEKMEEAAVAESDNKQTRRQFIKIAGVSMLAAAASLGGKTVQATRKTLRPPGALPESEFMSVCNRCGRCIKVCPNNALQPMPITDGIEYFDTPQIIPRKANCSLCLTCQEVCPTGAITKVSLDQVHMGKAELNRQRCLAWKDKKFCLICAEQCPFQAIKYDDQKRPSVQTDKCVGCGTCERACAVIGEAAIRVRPK